MMIMKSKKIFANTSITYVNYYNSNNNNMIAQRTNHQLHKAHIVKRSSCVDGIVVSHMTITNPSKLTAMSTRNKLHSIYTERHNNSHMGLKGSFISSGNGSCRDDEVQQRRQNEIIDESCMAQKSTQNQDNGNAFDLQRILNSAKSRLSSSSMSSNKSNKIFTSLAPQLVHNKSKYPSIKYTSDIILLIILAATSSLFMSIINAKEIDSKQDLQEEESTNLSAEHRTYLTGSQGPNIYHQVANSQNRQQYMTTSGHPIIGQIQGGHHHPQAHQTVNHQHQIHSGSENHVYIEPNGAPVQSSADNNIYTGSPGATAGALVSQAASGDVGGPMTQQSGAVGSVSASTPDMEAGNWPLVRSDLPHIRALNVKCEKNHMTVNIVFDKAFYGLVFSKGHYSDTKCVHLPPNSGQTSVNFDIHLGQCGMSSSDASGNSYPHGANSQTSLAAGGSASQGQPNGLYIENTIIIQYDPQVQEIWDQARKLRCTWYDYYEKSVTFRPYNVDMLDAVTANFLGDNIQCWMQIQVGKGPWQSEVAGIVKIGQTMTMVLAIKDDENKFDMLVRNCVAHDGNHKHQPIQLVDEYGCVARPKIMARFQKVRNFGPQATVVSYAYFQAFKFPDSMNVHFQCVIQVCRYECPEPVCSTESGGSSAAITGQGNAAPTVDYATSGTEIVTHKEPLPSSMTGQSYHHHHGMAISTGPVLSEQASSGIQTTIKMDENQGRAQVKLDTSMVAGGSSAVSGGALPPHLLHSTQATSQVHQVSKQYSKPQVVYTNVPPHSRHQIVANAPILHTGSPYSTMIKNNVPMMSQQHPTTNLISSHNGYTNRQGDSDNKKNHIMTMAMPRSMRSDEHTANTAKTKTSNEATKRLDRRRRQSHMDAINESTNVRTMKTIQVVSPGDVAFSLISNPNDTLATLYESIVNGSHNNDTTLNRSIKQATLNANMHQEHLTPGIQQLYKDYSSTICFTTTKFLFGITVSLILLTLAVCSAVFVLLRQKAKINEKLASVDDSSSDYTNSDCSTLGTYHLIVGVAPDSKKSNVNGHSYNQHTVNHRGQGINPGLPNLRHLYQSQQQQLKSCNNHLNSFYQPFESKNCIQQAPSKKVSNVAANNCGNFYGIDSSKSSPRSVKNSTSQSSHAMSQTPPQVNTKNQTTASNRASPR